MSDTPQPARTPSSRGEARWQSLHARAVAETLERAAERIVNALEPDTPPSALEPARLLFDDVQRIVARTRYVVRQIEALGPDEVA